MRSNFIKADPFAITYSNLPYDLKSVMHYGRYAFGSGDMTIQAKRHPLLKLGNNKGLSPGDVDEVKRLYQCDGKYLNLLEVLLPGILKLYSKTIITGFS